MKQAYNKEKVLLSTSTWTVDIAQSFINRENLGIVVLVLHTHNQLDTLLSNDDCKRFIADLIIEGNSGETPIYNLGYLLYPNNPQLNKIIASIQGLTKMLAKGKDYIQSALDSAAETRVENITKLYHELHPTEDTGILGDNTDSDTP